LSLQSLYENLFKGELGRLDAKTPGVGPFDRFPHEEGELLHRCIWMGCLSGRSHMKMYAVGKNRCALLEQIGAEMYAVARPEAHWLALVDTKLATGD
jgi:hypothetical protein